MVGQIGIKHAGLCLQVAASHVGQSQWHRINSCQLDHRTLTMFESKILNRFNANRILNRLSENPFADKQRQDLVTAMVTLIGGNFGDQPVYRFIVKFIKNQHFTSRRVLVIQLNG